MQTHIPEIPLQLTAETINNTAFRTANGSTDRYKISDVDRNRRDGSNIADWREGAFHIRAAIMEDVRDGSLRV